MAKTNFSGPITAGKIQNTTGVLPSQNVRNTGYVVMSQTFAFDDEFLNFDADSIATAAANGVGTAAGLLTLTNTVDGTTASGSFVLPNSNLDRAGVYGAAKVAITSSGNDAGRTFTIVGTDLFGNSQTEGTITGPNAAATVQSTLLYRTITSVTLVGGVSIGAITIGYDAANGTAAATQANYPLKSLWNFFSNVESVTTSNKNLTNNINIPANSRIVNWRVHLPIAFDMGGASTIGFGTSSFNNTNVPVIDLDYFTPSNAASLKTIATLNYADDFGTISAAQSVNFANVSNADTDPAQGNSTAGIDKEVLMVVNTAAGAAATNGVALITVEYLQSVNSVRSN